MQNHYMKSKFRIQLGSQIFMTSDYIGESIDVKLFFNVIDHHRLMVLLIRFHYNHHYSHHYNHYHHPFNLSSLSWRKFTSQYYNTTLITDTRPSLQHYHHYHYHHQLLLLLSIINIIIIFHYNYHHHYYYYFQMIVGSTLSMTLAEHPVIPGIQLTQVSLDVKPRSYSELSLLSSRSNSSIKSLKTIPSIRTRTESSELLLHFEVITNC